MPFNKAQLFSMSRGFLFMQSQAKTVCIAKKKNPEATLQGFVEVESGFE